MTRIKVSAEYPRPWWRRLLGLPAKRVNLGTGTVEPWPWVDITSDIRCPGCHTTVTRTQRTFGRTYEDGPFVNELTLQPCGHRFEGSDAGRLYGRLNEDRGRA